MKKIVVILGIVLGGSALFLGACLLILKMQGRLEGEELEAVSENPILGAFLSPPPAEDVEATEGVDAMDGEGSEIGIGDSTEGATLSGASKKTDESAPKRSRSKRSSSKPGRDVPIFKGADEGFTTKELMALFDDAKALKARCEQEWDAIEVEKANLKRLGSDLEDRKREIQQLMSSLSTRKAEMERLREEFRQECLSIEANEAKMVKTMTSIYEAMKPDEAAPHFNSMDPDQAVKIIVKMDTTASAKILAKMETGRVKEIMDRLSRFQEPAREMEKGSK